MNMGVGDDVDKLRRMQAHLPDAFLSTNDVIRFHRLGIPASASCTRLSQKLVTFIFSEWRGFAISTGNVMREYARHCSVAQCGPYIILCCDVVVHGQGQAFDQPHFDSSDRPRRPDLRQALYYIGRVP